MEGFPQPGTLGLVVAIGIVVLFEAFALPLPASSSGWAKATAVGADQAGNTAQPSVTVDSEVASPIAAMNGWEPAVPVGKTVVEEYWGSASEAKVAVDVQGNALALWAQRHGSSWGVWADWYNASSGWGDPTRVSDGSSEGGEAQIAIDSRGNAIAVWMQWADPGAAWSIWANRYVVGTGWGLASTIEASSYGALSPQIAADPEGNAIAVWTEEDAASVNIWATRYAVGQGWGTPSPLESGPDDAYAGHVAIGPQGNAMVLWRQWNATHYDLWSRTYAVGSGWGPIMPGPASEGGIEHKLVADSQGNFVAVWEGGSPRRIWSNRWVDGAGWQSAVPISMSGLDASSADLRLDATGNAVAVWQQRNGTSVDIQANRYVVGQGWGNPSFVGVGTTNLVVVDSVPQIAVDGGGNATVVWERSGFRGHDIWANRYTTGTGWGQATLVETRPEDAYMPQVVAEPQGNSLAIWSQGFGFRDHIWSNRFVPGIGWGPATLVERKSGVALGPQIAMDGQGNAIALWYQGDGVGYEVWSNRYAAGSVWDVPRSVSSSQGDALSPRLGTDLAGGAIAVWERRNGSRSGIWASRYVAGWNSPVEIDSLSQDAYAPQVAVDDYGDAIVVWQQWTGSNYSIWANRYAIGLDWGTAAMISSGTEGDGYAPQVVSNRIGNAIAVWEERTGARVRIRANLYVVGVGWGVAQAIDSGTTNASAPRPAIDSLGNAIVVWEQGNDTQTRIWCNRFTAGVGWGGASAFATGRGTAAEPRIGMDQYNNAIVVWRETGSSPTAGSVLRGSRYTAGVGWDATILIAMTSGEVWDPQIAVGAKGSGLAIWRECGYAYWGPCDKIWASRYVPYRGWTNATLIEVVNAGGYVDASPQIAVDSFGNATVIWTTWDNIWAARYVENSTAPDLVISAPAFALTNNPVVTVSGRTTPGAAVFVDGATASVDSAGAFGYSVTLPDGPHTFVIVAMTHDGAVSVATVKVTVDTLPPTLAIASPTSNTITRDGTVAVSGTTDPDARLVVNGLLGAVGPDGTFSVRVGLVEGLNTIAVTATDVAGNVATASAAVTYANPLVQDLALMRSVSIASTVGLLVLGSLVVGLHLARWRKELSEPSGSPSSPQSEDPNDSSSQGRDVQRQANGGVLVRGHVVEKRWPSIQNSGQVRLTAKERILLQLLHFARYADAPEVPRELTQERIVEAAGIDRRHFAQYVHPLTEAGLIRERTAHVRGVVQRRRVYVLTGEGRNRALAVRDRIRSAVVRVRDASGIREATVAEALLESRGSMSVLDILRESIETGFVDLTR